MFGAPAVFLHAPFDDLDQREDVRKYPSEIPEKRLSARKDSERKGMQPLPGVWSNLTLDEKIADRTLSIFLATDEMRGILALADETPALIPYKRFAEAVHRLFRILFPHFKLSRTAAPTRDPELEDVLTKLDADLSNCQRVRGRELDERWEQIERDAAPYAIALYYEIRRLDRLCIRGTSFMVDISER